MWSNRRLKLDYLVTDYQELVKALQGQRFTLILYDKGQYYWETAVLSIVCHRIISGLHCYVLGL
jgi:hypothetical protein